VPPFMLSVAVVDLVAVDVDNRIVGCREVSAMAARGCTGTQTIRASAAASAARRALPPPLELAICLAFIFYLP
jgi:hypothetical protein